MRNIAFLAAGITCGLILTAVAGAATLVDPLDGARPAVNQR